MPLVSPKAVIGTALASSMSAMGNSREGAFISANQLNLVHQIERYSGRSDEWKQSHDEIFKGLMEFYRPMFKSQLAIPSDDETSDLSGSHSMEQLGISVSTRAPHGNFFTIVTHMGTCTIQIPADKGYLGVSTNGNRACFYTEERLKVGKECEGKLFLVAKRGAPKPHFVQQFEGQIIHWGTLLSQQCVSTPTCITPVFNAVNKLMDNFVEGKKNAFLFCDVHQSPEHTSVISALMADGATHQYGDKVYIITENDPVSNGLKNKFPDHFYTEPDIRTALNEISQRGSKMQLSKIIKEATDLSKKIGFDLNIRTVKEAVKTNNKEVLKKFLHQYRDLCFANAAWGAHTQGKKVVLILGYNHGKSPVIRHILEKINTIQEQEEKVEL